MNIVDYIIIGLLLIFAIVGYITGIAKIVLRFAATVGAAVLSRIAASPVSELIYSKCISPSVVDKINEVIPSGSVSWGSAFFDILKSVLPDKVYSIAAFLNLIPDGEYAGETFTAAQIEADYIKPIITKVLVIITCIVLFIVLSIILMLIANALNKVFFEDKKGVIGGLNRLGGALFGAIRGAIVAVVLCLVLNLIAPLISAPSFASLVGGSVICGFVSGIFK